MRLGCKVDTYAYDLHAQFVDTKCLIFMSPFCKNVEIYTVKN